MWLRSRSACSAAPTKRHATRNVCLSTVSFPPAASSPDHPPILSPRTASPPRTPPTPRVAEVETLPEMREAKRAYAAFESTALGATRSPVGRNADLDQIMSGRLERAVEARAAAARRLRALEEEDRKREQAAALR